MKTIVLILVISAMLLLYGCQGGNLTVDQRVESLVSQMTLEEKISQMSHLAPGIERLGVIPYEPNFDNPYGQISFEFSNDEADIYKERRPWENMDAWEEMDLGCLDGGYWNEALHGVARAGLATTFPQCIGLGSTWNPALIQKMTDATSTEARVHNNVYGKKLTFWSPTINILRDPRWGRNEESYSEDPYLLSRMAVAFVKGLQGEDPTYLKAVATVKHFVANNSEFNRHDGSSDVSERLLREYYFPAYKAAIMEGGAMSVMSAYNALNGIPASANSWLLDDILRKEWDFKGYVVSDCGAISDIIHNHKYETDPEKAVALAVKAGTDLECETCGTEHFLYDKYLPGAVEKGYLTEADIDNAVKRLMRARMLLGEFDSPDQVPYTKISKDKLDCQEHRDLALQIARESIVLLKNEGNTLPLKRETIKSIAVIGPNGNVAELGGYSGTPAVKVTPLQGITDLVGQDIDVKYEMGCLVSDVLNEEQVEKDGYEINKDFDEDAGIGNAVKLAEKSDMVLLFVGTNLAVANEEADRNDLDLPGRQLELVQKVYQANKNVVLVLINGMSLTINWIDENIPAIVEAWYPGQAGGTAVAEVLFGDYNPGGKLPVTFYKNLEDLPPLGDYDITKGRTYMYFKGDVLYPFGYGLSYTSFEFSNLKIDNDRFNAGEEISVSMDIKNTGQLKGDEVVQLYIKNIDSEVVKPIKKLRRFERVPLNKDEIKTIRFKLNQDDFSYWNDSMKDWTVDAGEYEIMIGASSADIKLKTIVTVQI
jgi:beta-glucosidase